MILHMYHTRGNVAVGSRKPATQQKEFHKVCRKRSHRTINQSCSLYFHVSVHVFGTFREVPEEQRMIVKYMTSPLKRKN